MNYYHTKPSGKLIVYYNKTQWIKFNMNLLFDMLVVIFLISWISLPRQTTKIGALQIKVISQ